MRKLVSFVVMLFLVGSALPVNAAGVSHPSKVVMTVVFKNNRIPQEMSAYFKKNDVKVLMELPQVGALQIEADADMIPILQKHHDVQAISPSIGMTLPDVSNATNESPNISGPGPGGPPPDFPYLYDEYQWDIKRVTNDGLSFETEKGNHNVVVGIIDSGVSTNHEALRDNLLGGKNFVPKGDYSGTNTEEQGTETDIEDRLGHGSHVAGTIAGKGGIQGVAPDVGYKAYRVFGSEGIASTTTIAKAIIGATDDAVDVINMSVGGYNVVGQIFWTDPATGKKYAVGSEMADFLLYKRAVKYALSHGVTVVAAAGNDGLDITNRKKVTDYLNKHYAPEGYSYVGASVELPGNLPGVITVSATAPDDVLASYSNYGPGVIDVAAPGGDVNFNAEACFSASIERYALMAGTSMATPKVTAVAALLIAKEGKMSPSMVEQRIKETAQDIGPNGTDRYFGSGMVQAPYTPKPLDKHIEWQKSFGSMNTDTGKVIHQTKDGGYIAVGTTSSFATYGAYEADIYVVKMAKDGVTEWRKSLGNDFYEKGFAVEETKDGYLVVGNTELKFEDMDLGIKGESGIRMVKLDKAGNTIWEQVIKQNDTYTNGNAMIKNTNGNYMIVGNRKVTESDSFHAFLVEVDPSGRVIWERTYDNGEYMSKDALVVKQTSEGGYVLGGEVSYGTLQKNDFLVMKVNQAGELIWEKVYGPETNDLINDILVAPDGNLIIAGQSSKTVYGEWGMPTEENYQYLGKLDAQGNVLHESQMNLSIKGVFFQAVLFEDGYLFVGNKRNEDRTEDIYLVKTDYNISKKEEIILGGDVSDSASYVEQTKDNDFILVGETKSYNFGGNNVDSLLVMKVNLTEN